MSFDTKKLEKYPTKQGVYLMKDRQNIVLYIGKAKNLKQRIKQYFLPYRDTREMIPLLISQVFLIDTIVVTSEKEALLLENNLIKKHKPKYNVLLKDDKTYLSILLTKHKWPMLKVIRYKKKRKDLGQYFGPFTNAKAARQTLDITLRLFPLRQCSDAELKNRTRPCLLYDIKRCIAPCVGRCSKDEYQVNVQAAKKLLLGKDKQVLKQLHKKMQQASDELEFEKAGEYHRMIRQIEHTLQVQHVDTPFAKDCDVLGMFRKADSLVLSVLAFREGKLISSDHFTFDQIIQEDEEIFTSFILQHYKQKPPPSQILVPIALPSSAAEDALFEYAKKQVKITNPKRGDKLKLIELAQKNAHALFEREEDMRSLKERMLLDLQEKLKLTRFPRKIECFDTSNFSGDEPVASMVCFINGEKATSKMKLFKVKGANRSDDYSAMKEVLYRHFAKEKEKNDFCDLLIVDGGKGHLNLALQIFKKLNIASIDVIGLAKEKALHTKGLNREKIYLPYAKDPIDVQARSPLLFLLQKIRDEAHRVAIGFHRKRLSKKTMTSKLDQIEGIGPIKRKRLLMHFGSVAKIKQATKQELEDVPGLTKKDIQSILKL